MRTGLPECQRQIDQHAYAQKVPYHDPMAFDFRKLQRECPSKRITATERETNGNNKSLIEFIRLNPACHGTRNNTGKQEEENGG